MNSEIFKFDNIEKAVIEQGLKESASISDVFHHKFNLRKIKERKKTSGLYGGSPRESPIRSISL